MSTRLRGKASSLRSRRGYTMVEVMMGLAILAVGSAAIVALQRFAVMGTMTSRHVTNATNIGVTVLESVSLESNRWVNNSSGGSLTAANMAWLGPALAAPNTWVAPAQHGFRLDGAAVDATTANPADQVAYCTHVRAIFLGNVNAVGPLDAADAARIEVRTYYAKTGRTIAPECRNLSGADVTSLFQNTDQNVLSLNRNRSEYGVVYLSTIVRRNP
ncbi:MAG: prepilin-type N-terminal cleavage/methylation domain-containing protein [Polyangiaceae bacterium]|nr:prepilin-type N-terminal cleavage/methylation domain-containing protein [Polyangiaceae bacterium]